VVRGLLYLDSSTGGSYESPYSWFAYRSCPRRTGARVGCAHARDARTGDCSSVAPAAAPAPAATSDSSRYAQREKQDKKVADYEGGSVIVIGASGTVLLALLILLLVI